MRELLEERSVNLTESVRLLTLNASALPTEKESHGT